MDFLIEEVQQGRLCHKNTNGDRQQSPESQWNEFAFVATGNTLDQGPVDRKDDTTHENAQEAGCEKAGSNGTEEIGPGKRSKKPGAQHAHSYNGIPVPVNHTIPDQFFFGCGQPPQKAIPFARGIRSPMDNRGCLFLHNKGLKQKTAEVGEYQVEVGTIKERFKTGMARVKSRFKAILTDYNTENPQF